MLSLKRAAVCNPGYAFELSRKLLKTQMPKPHSRPIKSKPLAGYPDIIISMWLCLLSPCSSMAVVLRLASVSALPGGPNKAQMLPGLPPQFPGE